jgi:energy-coupling factor transporter transmembrane protein EcfT
MFSIFFKNGLEFLVFKRILLYAFLFSFSFLMINVLYPSSALKMGKIYQIGHVKIYYASLMQATQTMIRLFFISFFSMSSGAVIDYTKVVLYLIVHRGLRPFWGYPLLLALNSIALFKKEFERIRINARFRNLPLKDKLSLFFPLLVFAIRHSQRGALSLVTRGLNDKKNFYFSYHLSHQDKKWPKIFWPFYLILVGGALFTSFLVV